MMDTNKRTRPRAGRIARLGTRLADRWSRAAFRWELFARRLGRRRRRAGRAFTRRRTRLTQAASAVRRLRAQNPARTRSKLAVAVVMAAIVGAGVVTPVVVLSEVGEPPTEPRVVSRSSEEPAVAVPVVHGSTASQARDALADAGLMLADVEPTAGVPGVVVDSRPAAGELVAPGSEITLVVGVEPVRLSPSPR